MANPLMNLMRKTAGNNPLIELMSCKNPQQMVQSMIKKNPNLQAAWNQAQQLASGNKEEVIDKICKEKGLSRDQVVSEAQKFGINIR